MVNISAAIEEAKNGVIINFIVMGLIALSGIAMSIAYYIIALVESGFRSASCDIPNNVLFSTCQEWFELYLYPFLGLKSVLIFATYFGIFGLSAGLFYLGFKTRKHPSLIIGHIAVSVLIGYLAIEIGNMYRTLLENQVMYNILVSFPIYNKVMLYFPQFIFFVVFLSGLIGFMGLFKGQGQFKEGVDDIVP